MISFLATCFYGVSSRGYPVTIVFDGEKVRITGGTGVPVRVAEPGGVEVQPQLGTLRRILIFPGGVRCETEESAAVQQLERALNQNRGMRIVHFLEQRWRAVLACFAALLASVWIFTAWGIPALAKSAAFSMPHDVTETLSRKSLAMIDKHYLSPSQLPEERSAQLQQSFSAVLDGMDSPFDYRILFRASPILGPNAFALPSGVIVFTDELVELAENDDELTGILLHEIAHVEQRHALRSILQNTGVAILISALVGDIVGISSTAAAIPTLLVELGYSRRFEREADHEAGIRMMQIGMGTKPFRNVLERLAARTDQGQPLPMLSTHPGVEERIRLLKEIESAFRPEDPKPEAREAPGSA